MVDSCETGATNGILKVNAKGDVAEITPSPSFFNKM